MLDDFFSSTRSLNQGELDWLLGQGVPPLSLARDAGEIGFAIGSAKAVFVGGFFDFAADDAEDAVPTICLVVRDETGAPADIVAWQPRTGQMATHVGAVSMVGEQNTRRPRLNGPLRVHRDLLGWLKSNREGVVIVNPTRALNVLSFAGTLQAEDVDHGLALRTALRPPEINIVIPNHSSRSVAA
jgi:hypothetical protein